MNTESVKITPMYDEKEFLRKVWISMAKEDAPLEVFEQDFSEVTQKQYRICSGTASYDTTWSAEIGNDRVETYTDYEKYYEKIPYTEQVKKYNASTKQYEYVPEQKYRQEERYRPVTKKRTVTDWMPGSGEHSGSVRCLGCLEKLNSEGLERFSNDFKTADDGCISALSYEELENNPDMQVTEFVSDSVYKWHEPRIERQLERALPGDHNRNVHYKITSYDQTDITLFAAPEYSASITYNGKTYPKRAFAFGNMTVDGVKIPNPQSIEEIKKQKRKATSEEIQKRNDAVDGKVWKSTAMLSLISIALLAVSIVVSVSLKFLMPVIVSFAAAFVAFVFSRIQLSQKKTAIKEATEKENKEAQALCDDACANYESHKKAEILEVLNKKLDTLGLAPASDSEYSV